MHKMIARLSLTILIMLAAPLNVAAQSQSTQTQSQAPQPAQPQNTQVQAQQTQSAQNSQTQSAPNMQTQVATSEGITLELTQSTQHPESKAISFTVVIRSQLNSDRAQLRWDILGPAEVVSGNRVQPLTLVAGQTYSFNLVIVPRGNNRVDLRAIAEAFEIDGNRQSSVTQSLVFAANGEVLFPQVGQHELMKTILTVRNTAGGILLTLIGLFVVYRFGRATYIWFNE